MGYIHVDVHRAICLVQSTGFCLVVFQLLSLLFIATTMLGPSWWQHHPVWARHYLLCPALGSWWGSTLCSQGEHLTFQPGPVCFWGPSSAVWPRASVFITPPGAPGLTPSPVYHKDSFAHFRCSSSPAQLKGIDTHHLHCFFPAHHLLPIQNLPFSPFQSRLPTAGEEAQVLDANNKPHVSPKLLLPSSPWLTRGRLATGP